MFTATLALSAAILVIAAIQVWGVCYYVGWLRHYHVPAEKRDRWPRAAVVMSLRGADPFLEECLLRLSQQDYPNYEVHLVVDHPTDPACEVVKQWIAEHSERPFRLSFLEQRFEHAYLKASAVRQSLLKLDKNIEVAVVVDADTLVNRGWLKDMVTPFLNGKVGSVTGNRWYDPNVAGWGTLVRYIYNAACVLPMYLLRATWGGSLAVHRSVFDTVYFSQRSLEIFSEEPTIQDATQHAGLILEMQPNAFVLNREQCTVSSCFRFVSRQLLWTRLYHPNWWQVVAGVVGTYLVLSAAFFLAIIAALKGMHGIAAGMAAVICFELLVSQWSIERLHAAVMRRISRAHGEPFLAISMFARLRLLVALPLALVVLSWTLIYATFARRVSWRGVDYEVVVPNELRLVNYMPYAQVVSQKNERESLV